MSKEIKNEILLAATKKNSPEQYVSHDLLKYVLEMHKEEVIGYFQANFDERGIRVDITEEGEALLRNGGYK